MIVWEQCAFSKNRSLNFGFSWASHTPRDAGQPYRAAAPCQPRDREGNSQHAENYSGPYSQLCLKVSVL